MKNIYLLVLTLVSFGAHSQFIYWKSNSEIPDKAMVFMNDNSSKTGFIKNNKIAKVAKRMLTLDPKLFRHADVQADVILFKEDESENYSEIVSNQIKYVVFGGEQPTRFDRINVYKFDKKTLEIDDKEPVTMFQIPRVNGFIVMYSNIYINIGSNGSLNDELYFYVKQKDSDKTYYMRFYSFGKSRTKMDSFKILAPNNKKFLDYIDKLCEKGTEENQEFETLEKNVLEEVSQYLKKNRKGLSIVDQRTIEYNAHYGFMFDFIGKKLEELSS